MSKARPLPLNPADATPINDLVSLVKHDGEWSYFYGLQPIHRHPEGDERCFHLALAMMCEQGICTCSEVIRALKVPKRSLCRYTEIYRKEGIPGFFKPKVGRGPSVMTAEVTAKAQALLDQGRSRIEVSKELGVPYDTLRKATEAGRLRDPRKGGGTGAAPIPSGISSPGIPVDKSARSQADCDASAGMGIACTRPADRVLASIGALPGGASMEFQPGHDISLGGLLCALPALAANGLFRHLDVLPVLSGFYATLHIILVLAFMALGRIKSVDKLKAGEPGELGKLMGLDRVPEVRCLREKLASLSQDDVPHKWAALLSKDWMEQNQDLAGTLYADGHVRLYHGDQTKLPKRFVSRQRLCLRGTTDYWINDAIGQPFFSVERTIDHGLLEALRTDIVPRLLKDVPNQPTEQQLKEDPYLSRFVIVFDREGYSPVFFRKMWLEHRIACITYHKHPKKNWPECWFKETQIQMPGGEWVKMRLAEMGTWIGGRGAEPTLEAHPGEPHGDKPVQSPAKHSKPAKEKKKRAGLWVREVRKLGKSGHQTSLISTAYGLPGPECAGRLFSRWCQENFFRYMMENYAIDALNEYSTEKIPGTVNPVVNPVWRDLDRQHKSIKGKLTVRQARFADLTLHPHAEELEILKWEREKSALQEEIGQFEHQANTVKEQLKVVPHHVLWDELPEKDRFERLAPGRKRLMDTVKLVAYRAETAMAGIVREKMSHPDEARSLVKSILHSAADIIPDESSGELNVKLHTLATPRDNLAAKHLLDHLNAAGFTYPGTALRLMFSLPSPPGKQQTTPD